LIDDQGNQVPDTLVRIKVSLDPAQKQDWSATVEINDPRSVPNTTSRTVKLGYEYPQNGGFNYWFFEGFSLQRSAAIWCENAHCTTGIQEASIFYLTDSQTRYGWDHCQPWIPTQP